MNKPPFEINENILNLVANITERITKLELKTDISKDLYLRKTSKIKSVNSSCAIEANTLSEEEVTSIINGKKVIAPANEISEVKNAFDAYVNIYNYDPYDVNSFLDAHEILTRDLVKDSGNFRRGNVGVFDGNKVMHMGANPEYVRKLVKNLFDWAKTSKLNPLIKSSVIHFEIEFIHPFSDGNGRIGRLWQSLILYKYNSIFEYLPIETLVYKNQQKYYNALSKSEIDASSTAFIEFMLEMILQTIETYDYINDLSMIKSNYMNKLTKTEKEILSIIIKHFRENQFINSEVAVRILNKESTNVRKYFKKFVELNILIEIGKNKGRKYSLNKNILDNKNNIL